MKHVTVTCGILLMCSQISVGAISDWSFDHSKTYRPTDSLSFSYSSDRDSTVTRIFLETGDASSGLSTSDDKLLFSIKLIDNKTEEVWGENKGLMPDGDPTVGAYLFSPGKTGLAPALYHVAVTDGESTIIDSFRVAGIENPYRTISGKVYPPDGQSASMLNVQLEGMNMDYSPSAWTNAAGEYSIGIDQQTIGTTGGKVRVRVDARFTGYIPEPGVHEVDLSAGNKTGADFKFVKAECLLTGTVRAGDAILADVRVGLQNTINNEYSSVSTNESGVYRIECRPGIYRIRAEIDKSSERYMSPNEVKVELLSGETKQVDISVPVANAFVYARVMVKGNTPTSMFAVTAWNQDLGGNRRITTAAGYVAIPVVATSQKYGISLEKDNQYPIPEGLTVEDGKTWVEVAVGDTARFNLVDKPAGGISGTIENTTTYNAKRFFVRVYTADSSKNTFQVETAQAGAYIFDGIPAGTYFAEAGMSVEGDEWKWVAHQRYTDESGISKKIIISDAVVPNINWKFTAVDTVTNPPIEQNGTGVLTLKIKSTVTASIEKGMVILLEKIPMQGENIQPMKTFPVGNVDSSMVFTEVPNKKLYVVVEVAGKTGTTYARYRTFAKNSDGSPRMLGFDSIAAFNVTVEISDKDRVNDSTGTIIDPPKGEGKISGTVTYNGNLPKDKMFALLYSLDNDDWVRGVPPDTKGFYFIDKIPAGKYRVGAAIDTNGDKQPEAVIVDEQVYTVTGTESYENVNLTLVDKPVGSGSIEGMVSGFTGMPANAAIIVGAIAVDSTKPLDGQLNMVAFMTGYHAKMDKPGSFVLEMLPKGVYVVIALAEVEDSVHKTTNEVGFGMYGTLTIDSSSDMPFDPKFVVITEGQKIENVAILLMKNEKSGDVPVVVTRQTSLPSAYGFTSAVINKTGRTFVLRFALPEKAAVVFAVYDMAGKVIEKYQQGVVAAGYHTMTLSTSGGRARGMYIVQMKTSRFMQARVLTLVR